LRALFLSSTKLILTLWRGVYVSRGTSVAHDHNVHKPMITKTTTRNSMLLGNEGWVALENERGDYLRVGIAGELV